MENLIQIENISFSFPGAEKSLLKDISFKIANREWICLRGASGSGKSTLARIIAGHLVPSKGTVLINAQEKTAKPCREIILIHQEDDLFPWLTVEKQIQMAEPKQSPQEVSRLIELVSLEKFKDYFPSQLSGGMKKRLSMARALACKPKLIILDESLSSLDMKLRKELAQVLVDIWKHTNTSILQITHQDNEFDFLSPRNFELKTSGQLVEI